MPNPLWKTVPSQCCSLCGRRSQARVLTICYILFHLTQEVQRLCLKFSPKNIYLIELYKMACFSFKILGDKGPEPTTSNSMYKGIF